MHIYYHRHLLFPATILNIIKGATEIFLFFVLELENVLLEFLPTKVKNLSVGLAVIWVSTAWWAYYHIQQHIASHSVHYDF